MYHTLVNDTDNLNKTAMSKSHYSSFFTVKHRSKFEQLLINKLGYEWKQIYRSLVNIDSDNLGILHIDDFLRSCEKFGVSLIPLEVKKLMK